MERIASPLAAAVAILFFATASISSARLSAQRSAPTSTAPPVITGTTTEGSTLSASTGTWTSRAATTYTYAWQRCSTSSGCASISGATTSTYLLATADVGSQIRVSVTATSRYGSATATSALTATIAPLPAPASPVAPSNTTAPAISGTAQQGQVLTASTGSWSGTAPMTYAYQWYFCDSTGATCSPIAGYTSATYTPVSWDVGGRDKVGVTATNAAGSSVAYSAMTVVIASAPVPTTISPSTLTGGTVGKAYSATISVSGSSGPYTTRVTQGTLPSGLSLGAGGQLTGTPTTAGNATFTVSALDSTGGPAASQSYTLPIASASTGTTYFDSSPNVTKTLAPWDYFDPGDAYYSVSSYPNGKTTPGTVRVVNDPLGVQGLVYEETVTPTAHASTSPDSDSTYLWFSAGKSWFGHDTQENWEHFRIMLPTGAYTPTSGSWNWLVEHHNNGGYQQFVSSGAITSEYPELCWGVDTTKTVADGTVKPQLFMRVWGGNDNTPSSPNQSPSLYVYAKQALQTNHWYDFRVHVIWSPDSGTGLVEWWLDGNLLFSQHHATLWRRPDGTTDVTNFEANNYRAHATWNSTVYYSQVKVGSTSSSVDF